MLCNRCLNCQLLDERPIVEKFLARDVLILDRVEADFFLRAALATGFGGVFEQAVDGKPAGVGVGVAAEERPAKLLAMEDVVTLKDLGLADDRLLANGFLAVAFD